MFLSSRGTEVQLALATIRGNKAAADLRHMGLVEDMASNCGQRFFDQKLFMFKSYFKKM